MTAAPPPPALVEGLTEFCAALLKAQQDFRRYPRNNPILARRLDELLQRLAPLLRAEPVLRLAVGADTLTYEGAEVYRGPERSSLTAPLHRHGIRELSLHRGVTRGDLEALLDALNHFPTEEHPDEDLLTFLWEKDLQGVRYAVVDDLPEQAAWSKDPLGTLSAILSAQPERPLAEAVAVARAEAQGTAPTHDPRASLQAVQLSAEQRQALQALREADRQQDVALGVIEVLLSVLRAGMGKRDVEELLRAVGRIAEVSIADGQLKRAATVLRQLRQTLAVEEDPAVAGAARATLERLCGVGVLGPLFERMQAGWEGLDERELEGLLRALPPAAAPALAGALERISELRMRRLLCYVIAGLVRDDVERLAPLMSSGSWFVARNLAYILGLTRNPAAQRLLRDLVGHPHERVRLEALRALSQFRGAATRGIVVRALDDPDAAVRLLALGLVGGYPDAQSARALLARLGERGFAKLDAQEKRAIATAAGRLAKEDALPELTALLQQRSLLGRSRNEEDRAAAVYGLAAVGGATAEALLGQAAAESPALRLVVEQALREAQAAPPLAAPPPELPPELPPEPPLEDA